MITIDTFLHRLCEVIRDKTTKSKQAAFDLFFSDITEAKKFYSWEQITDYINTSTNDNLAPSAYRNMLTRTKNKHKVPGKNISNTTKHKEQHVSQDEKKSVFVNDTSDLNSYLAVCFNNERLASRAIAGGVSIEQIRAWQCPNAIRLGTTLSNYLQNK
ncbi:hypothetical protein [Xenorhabdus budapestensis]|uniref:Uncharacterized protein n=1 Tax=Xenorhabdus budapestensis TaxID=290110 RepID=A0A2D0IT74_XENBU|nr:hypothetical protein [Xenorhabdus budapestensis]PHM25081.1 hypothetical protein Xbud_03157 [Xenorhabdus budapestensis]